MMAYTRTVGSTSITVNPDGSVVVRADAVALKPAEDVVDRVVRDIAREELTARAGRALHGSFAD